MHVDLATFSIDAFLQADTNPLTQRVFHSPPAPATGKL